MFVVRRVSADALEVWLEDDPDNRAYVPVAVTNDRLKVTSTAGTTTFVKGSRMPSERQPPALLNLAERSHTQPPLFAPTL